jgi:acyl CoA:acetate/3-ketoacid CoA transferase beta subunit
VRRRNTEGYPASTSGRIVRRGEVETLRSVGHRYGGDSRKELGYRSAGPTIVITDLGILRSDPRTKELTLTALHPGVTEEDLEEFGRISCDSPVIRAVSGSGARENGDSR